MPFILVYMFYIIFHGHLSPGGGFQGGVLMVAVVVFLYLGHGYKTTTQALSLGFMHEFEGFASILYVAFAMIGVAFAGNFCSFPVRQHRRSLVLRYYLSYEHRCRRKGPHRRRRAWSVHGWPSGHQCRRKGMR